MGIKLLLWSISLSLLLSGCGSDAIDAVKQLKMDSRQPLSGSPVLSRAEEIFGNRHICRQIDWEVIAEQYAGEVVEYRCILNGSEALLQRKYAHSLKQVNYEYKGDIANVENAISALNYTLGNLKKKLRVRHSKLDYAIKKKYALIDGKQHVHGEVYNHLLQTYSDRIVALEDDILHAKKDIPKYRAELARLKKAKVASLERINQEQQQTLLTMKQLFTDKNIHAIEVYHWLVDGHGKPKHIFFGLRLVDADQKVLASMPYDELYGTLEALYSNEASNIEESFFYRRHLFKLADKLVLSRQY